MPRIIVLDEVTTNQIAAGEVVERPASVVKELMENSFDAGASRVTVEIRGGGLDEIKVTDNGCGMDEADAVAAFQRHATSKISNIEDIDKICTLGFRGEALPSIAAVSKTVLLTRPPEISTGVHLEVQGGRLMSVAPAGCPAGASVRVRELFFNTPARLKYMKSKATEAGQAVDIVSRLALARPDIAVKLENDGRSVFRSAGTGKLLDALAAVYGVETARGMLDVEVLEDETEVVGLVAPPAAGRSTKRHISVIINGRYVRNRLITTAVIEGYGTLLPAGRYPLAVISVTLKPHLLDVNVHPAKMVVRVSGEEKLFAAVKRAVMTALRTDKIIPGLKSAGPPAVSGYEKLQQENAPFPYEFNLTPGDESTPATDTECSCSVSEGLPLYKANDDLLESIYPLGFLPPTYILAGSRSGLLIIDHHAAHERILYEKYLALFSGDKIEVQTLLIPAVVHLSPREYKAAEDRQGFLSSLGIYAEGFGSGSLAVRGIPAGLPKTSAEDLIRDLLELIIEPARNVQREDLVKKIAASTACREAIKSGTRSTLEEAWAVISDLKETAAPYTCPHGRPTMINISEQELKSRFKRT